MGVFLFLVALCEEFNPVSCFARKGFEPRHRRLAGRDKIANLFCSAYELFSNIPRCRIPASAIGAFLLMGVFLFLVALCEEFNPVSCSARKGFEPRHLTFHYPSCLNIWVLKRADWAIFRLNVMNLFLKKAKKNKNTYFVSCLK